MKTFSERFKELVSIKGLRAIDVVKLTKIPKSTVHHYMYGNYEPKYDVVVKIADKLNVAPEWLLGYDVPMYRNQDLADKVVKVSVLDVSGIEISTIQLVMTNRQAQNYFYLIAPEKIGNRICKNDLLLVYRTNEISSNEIVVVQRNDLYSVWTFKKIGEFSILQNEKGEVMFDDNYVIIGKVVKLEVDLNKTENK